MVLIICLVSGVINFLCYFLNGLCELELTRRHIVLGLSKDCLLRIAMYLIICFECRTRFYLVPRVLELTFDKYFKTEYNITYAICFACTTNKYSMHVQVKVKRDVMIHSLSKFTIL